MSLLELRYTYDASHFDPSLDRDDFGQLSVAVQTDVFSGSGRFWVQWQDVVEFGESLSVFPIKADAPRLIECGFNKLDGDDLIARVEIGPKDSLGELISRVEIADYVERWQRVRTWFRTDYPSIELFQREIAQLMAGETEAAILLGH